MLKKNRDNSVLMYVVLLVSLLHPEWCISYLNYDFFFLKSQSLQSHFNYIPMHLIQLTKNNYNDKSKRTNFTFSAISHLSKNFSYHSIQIIIFVTKALKNLVICVWSELKLTQSNHIIEFCFNGYCYFHLHIY